MTYYVSSAENDDALRRQKIDDDTECQPKVREREPRKY